MYAKVHLKTKWLLMIFGRNSGSSLKIGKECETNVRTYDIYARKLLHY